MTEDSPTETTVRLVAAQGLDSTPLEDGAVVFDPSSGKFVLLNRSAAFLWSQLTSPLQQEEMAARMCERFPDLPASTALADAAEAAVRMEELGLARRVHSSTV